MKEKKSATDYVIDNGRFFPGKTFSYYLFCRAEHKATVKKRLSVERALQAEMVAELSQWKD